MQLIFQTNATPDEYKRLGRSFPFPNLRDTLCNSCRKSKLSPHGFYERYLIATKFDELIEVKRYICNCCGKTVSLLPWFCHPRRAFSVELIHSILIKLLDWTESIGSFIREFSKSCGVIFSRQLLYQFRKRVVRNCNRILMEVTGQFNLKSPVSNSSEQERRVKDALKIIETIAPNPCQVSMNMFSHGSHTYLTL